MIDNDSRLTALKKFSKKRLGWLFNTSTFTGNLILAGIAYYFFEQLGHGEAVNFVFLVGVLAIGLWITEAIPPFAVGILIIGMLLFGFGTDFVVQETRDVEIYVDTWTSNVIWLLLGGFFLSEGMKVAGLDKQLFQFTLKRFGSSPRKLLLGLMLTTAIGSMVMSNTATTAMMISSILPLMRMLGKNTPITKIYLIGIPAAATIGGIGTIIGSTPNAIAVGALGEIGVKISFLDWMIFGIPTALLLIYLFFLYLKKSLPESFENLTIDWEQLKSKEKADLKNRIAVIITLLITISLWITEPLHGIPVAATSGIPIVLLSVSQVISAQNVRALPWDTLMLVAGGLALGIAVVDVGLSEIIMNTMFDISTNSAIVLIAFAYLGILLSNVMSNTAASAILVPLGLTLSAQYSVAAPLIISICCSCALLLPVSTPSNAIAFSTGLIEQKDFRKGGIFFLILGPIVSMAVIALYLWIR
jgi:solute carrier family 13 (sodium-dependent dicarboxylate transporter), member 2/3/5